jgi:hypothetical protein
MTFSPIGTDSAAALTPEAPRAETLRAELGALLERRTGSDGRHEAAIPELKLYRFSQLTEPAVVVQEQAVYVVVQGRRQVTVGGETITALDARNMAEHYLRHSCSRALRVRVATCPRPNRASPLFSSRPDHAA